jgi:hypothetical protein
MKKIFLSLLFLVSLNTGASEGENTAAGKAEESSEIATSAVNLQSDAYRLTETLPRSDYKRGFLEENEISIGTILASHHFNKYDYHDYNETHNGLYINVNRWSTGTYTNSADEQSVFVTYNPNIYRGNSIKVNLVAGISNGYEGWEYAQGDYLAILGFSAQWMYLKTVLSYDAVAFGLELPLN